MLKSRIQGFVAGLLAVILLVATFALASPAIREVFYGVNVVVNGELQEFDDDMQPFISDGRTFLPVRGIAEVLGIEVNWDGETQTVYIGEMPELLPIAPNIGDVIEFGGIQWRVLDLEDGKVLLLSEYLLEQVPYHNALEEVMWDTSDIRHWLNSEFYYRFATEERERIAETLVINNNDPWQDRSGGSDTVDKIFLLSFEELVQYLGDCENPAMAWADGHRNVAWIARFEGGDPGMWWLRSPSGADCCKGYIGYYGGILVTSPTQTDVAIRPAMWVYL